RVTGCNLTPTPRGDCAIISCLPALTTATPRVHVDAKEGLFRDFRRGGAGRRDLHRLSGEPRQSRGYAKGTAGGAGDGGAGRDEDGPGQAYRDRQRRALYDGCPAG